MSTRVPKGIEAIDRSRAFYGCKACGKRWAGRVLKGGRRARGSLQCPSGCNKPR